MQNKWTVEYYHSTRGDELARDEMRAFGAETYAKMLTVVSLLEDYGLSIPSRYVKHIEDKVWELRIDRYRVLYFTATGRHFVLLRAFAKKTEKTPVGEMRIAWNRLHNYLARNRGD
jgi:phage-related protein